MKRLIVYDLDGTLVDTLDDITFSANRMLRDFGEPEIDRSLVRGYVGRGMRELVAHCLRVSDEARITEGMTVYRRYYKSHMLDRSALYPQARSVLDHFTSRLQAVITNKPDPYATEILQGLGIAGYFRAIIAGDGVYPKKPDPASLLALMRQTGSAPEETVFVGDSRVDVQTGKAAGVFTVSVCHGLEDADVLEAASPDRIFPDFGQLLACALRESW